jgi:TonB family protein
MKLPRTASALIFAACACSFALNWQAAGATTFNLGTEAASKVTSPEPIFNPEPKIPAQLHENCFKSCCIAKFMVSASGKTDVKLLSSSGSTEIDEITLQTLRTWKFKPATLDGEPIEGVRKIQIEFQVD